MRGKAPDECKEPGTWWPDRAQRRAGQVESRAVMGNASLKA